MVLGLIQFPILLFLGLSFGVALATHKIASVALGIGAALRYLSGSVLEQKFVALMVLFGRTWCYFGCECNLTSTR